MLGSADVLGSPINFMRTLGTGVYDFFNEPAVAWKEKGAKQFGVGLVRVRVAVGH